MTWNTVNLFVKFVKEFLRLPALFSLSNKEAIGLEHVHRNLPGLGRHQCEESQAETGLGGAELLFLR